MLSIAGIVVYSAATAYVLGFGIWSRKDIIQFPSRHEASVVESTFKAFGFLFYGMWTSYATHEFACGTDYKPKYFYWELTVFARKLLVLIVSIWLPPVMSMMSRTIALAMIVFISAVSANSSTHAPVVDSL